MFYKLCYELIKCIVLIIVLHHLFLYLKNLFLEVYEFKPQEIALAEYIMPVAIDKDNSATSSNDKCINETSNIDNDVNNSKNNSTSDADIKDELLNFINNEFSDELGDNFDNTLADEPTVFE